MSTATSADALAHLRGRTVVLTGASRGIGAVLLHGLAACGAHVEVIGRRSAALDAQLAGLPRAGRVRLHEADLGEPSQLQRALDALAAAAPVVDAVVANAGITGRLVPLAELGADELREAFQVNVLSVHQVLRSLQPALLRAQAPRVLALSSAAASKLSPRWAAYATTKLAVEGLVKVYAAEQREGPLRANILRPGPTRTEMRASAYPQEDPATVKPPEALLPVFGWLLGPACDVSGECIEADRWLAQRAA